MSAVAMGTSSTALPSSPSPAEKGSRAEIRKRQNRDSARRSREKRKSHLRGVAESVELQSRRVRELDARVAQLEALVQRAVRPRNLRGGATSKKPPQAPRRTANNAAAVAAAAAAAAAAAVTPSVSHPVSSLEIQRTCAAPTPAVASQQTSVMDTAVHRAVSRSVGPSVPTPTAPISLSHPAHPTHPPFSPPNQASLALPAAALLEISTTPPSFQDIAPSQLMPPSNLHTPQLTAAPAPVSAATSTSPLYEVPPPVPTPYSQVQAPPQSALAFAIDPWTIGNEALDPLITSAPMTSSSTSGVITPSSHTTQHSTPSTSTFNYGL